MNSKILIPILLSLAFVSACTQTKEVEEPVLTFEEMDSDVDGYISSAEAKASRNIARNFKQIDSNNDGNITVTEYLVYVGKGRMAPPEDMESPEPGAAPY